MEDPSKEAQTSTKNAALFRCYLCSTTTQLNSEESLDQHLKAAHPKLKLYRCEECDKSTSVRSAFNKHLSMHDATVRPFKCSVCPLRFFNLTSQKRHEVNVHGLSNGWHTKQLVPRHACPTCGILFHYEWELRQHMKKAHRGSRKEYGCTICGKTFYLKLRLMKHEASHNDAAFKCYLCEPAYQLENNQALDKHFNAVHATQTVLRCRECDHVADDQRKLNKHLSQHVITLKPYKCSVCDLRFTARRFKTYHELTVHGIKTVKVLSCPVCHGMFADEQQKKLHKCHKLRQIMEKTNIYATQKSERRFSCKTCGKKFAFESSKIRHEQISHSKKAKVGTMLRLTLKCYFCKTRMESKNDLVKHLETAHASQFSNRCRKCNYSTSVMQKFNNHLMLHDSAARRFKCRFCSLRFLTAQYRKHHENYEHACEVKRQVYDCSDCGEKFASAFMLKLHGRISSHMTHKTVTTTVATSHEPSQKTIEPCPPSKKRKAQIVKRTSKCYLCSTATQMEDLESLDEHLEKAHPDQKSYHCKECNFYPHTKSTFNQHLSRHDASTRPHKCPSCPLRFKYPGGVREHAALVHFTEILKYACSKCDMKFHKETRRQSHEVTVHGIKHVLNACSKCGTTFLFKSRMKTHERNCEVPLLDRKELTKPFKCTVCLLKFTEAFSRTHHEASVHKIGNEKGIKLFRRNCSVCKTKIRSDIFEQHMTTEHPNERYDCRECELMFFNKKNLYFHKKSAHGKSQRTNTKTENPVKGTDAVKLQKTKPTAPVIAKTYKCNICTTNNTLESRDLLEQHLAGHPAQEMYNCDKCSFFVSSIVMFNQHLSTH